VIDIEEKPLFRPEEVARIFQVNRVTIYHWIDSGRLQARRICGHSIRIPRESVLEAIRDIDEVEDGTKQAKKGKGY